MKQTVVLFDAPGFTADDFDNVWEELRAAGQAHPRGLISHVGFEKPNGNWMVVDVWESPEAFAEFGNTLMPIFQKLGVNVPEPILLPAHYVLLGQMEEMHA